MSEEKVLLEMDYTTYDASCKDPHVSPAGDLIECRRQARHDNEHGTRGGENLISWGHHPE